MTVKELALFLGRSEKTVYRICEQLNIFIEHGKQKIFNKDEVEKIATACYKGLPQAIKESIDFTFNKIQLKTNVQSELKTNVQSEQVIDYEKLAKSIAVGLTPVLSAITDRINKLETKLDKLALPEPEYLTIDQFFNKNNLHHSIYWSRKRTNILRKICKDKNIDYRSRIINGVSQKVYPIEVLTDVYSDLIANPNKSVIN